MINKDEGYITAKEASDYLQIHLMTLYRLSHEGKIPGACIVGSHWRYNKKRLDDSFIYLKNGQ